MTMSVSEGQGLSENQGASEGHAARPLRPLRLGLVSAGSWGTALAVLAQRAGSEVTLYTGNANVLESIRLQRSNEVYLPGIFLDPAIVVTDTLEPIYQADIVLLAIPSQHVRATCIRLSDRLAADIPILLATKGIERGSFALMSEVVSATLPKNPVAVLTGPNFAAEAARGLPTATTIACADRALAERIMYGMGGKYFRPYYTSDIIGAQVGGAIKNVIAIACGIAIGKGFGENARAALITRGLAEIARLCRVKGGKQETLMGLSGIGDVMLTCSSATSRNMALGLELGTQNKPVKQILQHWRKRLAEGVSTADAVAEYTDKTGLSMPICKGVHDIIQGRHSIDETIHQLLQRPFVAEG